MKLNHPSQILTPTLGAKFPCELTHNPIARINSTEARPLALAMPSRRSLLLTAAALPMVMLGQASNAQESYHPHGFWEQPRSIWMKRPATGEEIKTVYWADGRLIQSEYNKICWFMRDVRMEQRIRNQVASGKAVSKDLFSVVAISPVLLDILYAIGGWLDYHNMSRALLLNSGFRHWITNALTEGSAKDSRHLYGGAGDIDIPGVNSAAVSAFGLWLRGGGIGWYPGKAFTHIDDGRLRFWKGK